MKKVPLSFSFLFGITLTLFSQSIVENNDGIALKEYLIKVEDHFDVRFSYLEKLIQDQQVSDQSLDRNTLDELLTSLQIESHLKFERLDSNYIVVRPFDASDVLSICGHVVDENKASLSDAHIQVKGRNIATVSDSSGFFQFNMVPYDGSVTIRYLGYELTNLPVETFLVSGCVDIQLTPSVNDLGEFVVTDYAIPGVAKVQNKLVFNPEQLKLLPGWIEPDIMQAIQLSPGVNSPYESAANLYIRGSTPDQNLVLWNGIKTYNQSHFFGALSAFNPYIPQKVEFIKNGVEPSYGDRVAGVISIDTNDEISDDFHGTAGVNMLHGDVYIEKPVIEDKLSIGISARRSYSDLLETPTYQRFADRVFQNTKVLLDDPSIQEVSTNEYFFHDLSGSILFKPNEDQYLRFNTLLTANELDFRSTSQGVNYQDFLKTGSDGFNIQWAKKLDGENQLSLEGYLINYGLYYEFMSNESGETALSQKQNSVNEKGLKTRYDWKINDRNSTSLGYEFSSNQIKYAFNQETSSYALVLDHDNRELNMHTFFAQHRMNLDGVLLRMGARLNYLDTWQKVYVEPRISAQYSKIKNVNLGGTFEYRTQTVSQIKESVVSDLSLENQVWTLSSPNGFPIITSNKISANVTYENAGWLFEMEGYTKTLDDITSLTFGFLNPDPSDNVYRVGSSDIRGIDLFLQKRTDRYSGLLSYSLINTENEFEGFNDQQRFPGNWNIRHTIKWTHFYKWRSFDFSLGWIWHSGKVFTDASAVNEDGEDFTIEFDRINRSTLPRYHRLDLSTAYRWNNSNGNVQYKLGLSLLNLYARNNLINRELRLTPSLDFDLLETEFYGLKLTPNIVFRILW